MVGVNTRRHRKLKRRGSSEQACIKKRNTDLWGEEKPEAMQKLLKERPIHGNLEGMLPGGESEKEKRGAAELIENSQLGESGKHEKNTNRRDVQEKSYFHLTKRQRTPATSELDKMRCTRRLGGAEPQPKLSPIHGVNICEGKAEKAAGWEIRRLKKNDHGVKRTTSGKRRTHHLGRKQPRKSANGQRERNLRRCLSSQLERARRRGVGLGRRVKEN